MNTALLLIIGIPVIEIYLFIKIGSQIGAFNTIILIFLTAIIGVAYAKHEGFNTLKSGISGLMKNEIPIYEIISGAALAFAALLPDGSSDSGVYLFKNSPKFIPRFVSTLTCCCKAEIPASGELN